MVSQCNMGKRGSVAEYNANNAWLYNGNNGNVNNNNKYNSNVVRPVLESYHVTDNLSRVFVPLKEWYKIYRICKKNCAKKTLHLRFRSDFVTNIVEICHDFNMMEYVAKRGICFTIEKPALREVIAADFTDKMMQTWYCEKVVPLLEARYLHPKKVYLQHYSKGVEMLGYKLRFNRMLPSDRISHNFKWKTQCTLRKAEANVAYRYGNSEHFMQTVNSYLGLLGWCNAYRLRRDVVETIKQSVYGDFYNFAEDYTKITLKTPYKRVMHFKRMNFDRKHKIKMQSWLKL